MQIAFWPEKQYVLCINSIGFPTRRTASMQKITVPQASLPIVKSDAAPRPDVLADGCNDLTAMGAYRYASSPLQRRADIAHEAAAPAAGLAEAAPASSIPAQINRTGLPDRLKYGIENLSGISLNNVKVHYNSHKPALIQAQAYAQGSEIHLAPGQQKHLPHEAWHVIQQHQGRVKPTIQLENGARVNNEPRLEQEADAMGTKAARISGIAPEGNGNGQTMAPGPLPWSSGAAPIQGVFTVGGEPLEEDWIRRIPIALQAAARDMARPESDAQNFGDWQEAITAAHGLAIQSPPQRLDDPEELLASSSMLAIGATQTGDIYHVKAAHALFPQLLICIYDAPVAPGNPAQQKKADNATMMANYFRGAVVCLTEAGKPGTDEPRERSASAYQSDLEDNGNASGFVLDVGQATSLVSIAVSANWEGVNAAISEGVAPIGAGDAEAYEADLRAHGFNHGTEYVIVVYRASGNRPGGIHPEHDTGRTGFIQLMNAVDETGAEPVDMGDYPAYTKSEEQATLRNYWTWDSVRNGGRAAEAGLIRYLAEHFNVTGAVGMRSGAMDMLAFVGIPILSIDVDPLQRQDFEEQPSWSRTNKLESAYWSDRYSTLYVNRSPQALAPDHSGTPSGEFGARDLRWISKELLARSERSRNPPADYERHFSHPYVAESADFADETIRWIVRDLRHPQTAETIAAHRRRLLRIEIVAQAAEDQKEYSHYDPAWNATWDNLLAAREAVDEAANALRRG